MHSGNYDLKSDLALSSYSSNDAYNSRKKYGNSYQPYNDYEQRKHYQADTSYEPYKRQRDERFDRSDYLSPHRKGYKHPSDYRNSVNVLPNYHNDLSINKQKRKHTADYTNERNHSPFFNQKKQKKHAEYDSKKYQPVHSPPSTSKYDLTSSSVSAYTTLDYNTRKKNYLDSSSVDNLTKSNVSTIQSRNYDRDIQKDYHKEALKEKYKNYFSPSMTKTTADQYSSASKISSPSYKLEDVPLIAHKSPQSKQYTSKSAREQYNSYNYNPKYGSSKYEDRDKYKVSSFQSVSQQKVVDKRFAKKKYFQQGKEKLKQINQLLTKSKVLNEYQSLNREGSYYSKPAPKIQKIQFRVSISDFHLGKTKGEGKFGTVYQAIHKPTGSIYAIKKIPKEIIKSHMLEGQLALEIKLQTYTDHPNILKMYGFFDDWQNIYIILEYMEQGTLFQYLKKRSNKLSEKQASKKIKQMTSAIKYLHDMDIAHRDIKPENIVISNGISKLCDFGWATRCTDRRKTYCGTFDYAAPQILEGKQYDWCVDLWCLGVLTFELLTGKAPFYHISRKQTMKKILRVDRDEIEYPKDISWKAKDFVQSLLKKNPNERRRAEDLITHPFLSEEK